MSATEQLLMEIRDGIQQVNRSIGRLTAAVRLSALQLPLSPKVLNEMINAANIRGVSIMGVNQLTVTVPAGQEVMVVLPTRPGTVGIATAPIDMSATYYSHGITLNVLVDGYMVTSPDYQFTLTGPDQLELGQYWYYQQSMVLVAHNTTATPTTITFKSEGLALEQKFFQSTYLPLLEHGFKALADLAHELNGGKA